jgi:hypothetical protein
MEKYAKNALFSGTDETLKGWNSKCQEQTKIPTFHSALLSNSAWFHHI